MDFDLQKKAATVNNILLAKGVKTAPVLRVGAALDISGSMHGIISRGALQKAFDQLMGVSVKFDDNGELDVFKFNTRCKYVGTSKPTKGDYDKYIKNNRIEADGGTNYGPIVEESINFFFGEQKKGGFLGFGAKSAPADDTPVLMLILTDGEPNDAREAEKLMKAAVDKPIYFHMVGIGGTRKDFRTIAHLADALPNVGEVYLPKLEMSDEDIYAQLICDELIEFIGKFSKPSQQQATA